VALVGALSDAIPDNMSVDEIMALFQKQEVLRASQDTPVGAHAQSTGEYYDEELDGEPADSALLDPLIEMSPSIPPEEFTSSGTGNQPAGKSGKSGKLGKWGKSKKKDSSSRNSSESGSGAEKKKKKKKKKN
jgi:hypothetical protein